MLLIHLRSQWIALLSVVVKPLQKSVEHELLVVREALQHLLHKRGHCRDHVFGDAPAGSSKRYIGDPFILSIWRAGNETLRVQCVDQACHIGGSHSHILADLVLCQAFLFRKVQSSEDRKASRRLRRTSHLEIASESSPLSNSAVKNSQTCFNRMGIHFWVKPLKLRSYAGSRPSGARRLSPPAGSSKDLCVLWRPQDSSS